jgi:glycosyltransferase involved in cell wall biosynthesis
MGRPPQKVKNNPGIGAVENALNLVTKAHFYYTQYGLSRTLIRVAEHLTGIQIQRLPQPLRSDGLATMILSSSDPASAPTMVNLTAGMSAAQELDAIFDEIFEIDLHIEFGDEFEKGVVMLVDGKGTELHHEPLNPKRARNGRYSMLFDKPLSVPEGARVQLVLQNSGTRGDIKIGVAPDPDFRLRHAVWHCARAREHDSALGSAIDLPCGCKRLPALALRVAGRSAAKHATYHRRPVPAAWRGPNIRLETLYTAGFRDSHVLPQSGLCEASVEALNSAEAQQASTPLLLLGRHLGIDRAHDLVAAAVRRFIPVVGMLNGEPTPKELGSLTISEQQLAHWSDLLIVRTEADAERLRHYAKALMVDVTQGANLETVLDEWLPSYRRRILPKISIVTILYNKAAELPAVLWSYFRQDYDGELEIIFVDDASPDDSVAVVERVFAEARASGQYPRLPQYKLVRHAANSGNCVSRNAGLANASGDIAVIVDADCMLNREFLTRHAQAHSFGDAQAVIGPLNIETEAEDPIECLRGLEVQPQLAARRTQLQDELNRFSFLNCITRNFSVRLDALHGELFDPAFTYSAAPDSGYGWEDVEMGYRLYRQGKPIKYVSDAFTVHVSPRAPALECSKPPKSAKNFRRLFEKHPDLRLVARHWARRTLKSLTTWFAACDVEPNDDLRALEAMLGEVRKGSAQHERATKRTDRVKVLTYRWHVPHQYELYKLGHDFALVRELGTSMSNAWNLQQRPLPDNARFISKDGLRENDFDLAILHFDENVLSWENTNNVLGEEWGASFRWLMENIRLPKVAICHGTPQFYGQYNPSYDKPDLMQVIEPARRKLVDYLGDTLVICNSHQAQREWGFRNSRVIWHGFDPTEFPPATYERGILSPLGPLVTSRPHYRGYFLYQQVFADFPAQFRPSTLTVPEPSPLYQGNQFAIWKYRNYVDEIRRYSVYFNPTLRSPMPRARSEPMMCGVLTVSARNHDVDMFIKNGVNGFYADEAGELREQLLFLSRDPAAAKKIGAEGRRTALDIFNIDRYLAEWRSVIRSLV